MVATKLSNDQNSNRMKGGGQANASSYHSLTLIDDNLVNPD
jgi:hypothetical protein